MGSDCGYYWSKGINNVKGKKCKYGGGGFQINLWLFKKREKSMTCSSFVVCRLKMEDIQSMFSGKFEVFCSLREVTLKHWVYEVRMSSKPICNSTIYRWRSDFNQRCYQECIQSAKEKSLFGAARAVKKIKLMSWESEVNRCSKRLHFHVDCELSLWTAWQNHFLSLRMRMQLGGNTGRKTNHIYIYIIKNK